ncbi:Coiled-coil domain-containing protein 61 [Holothuria leucospilota]|uniref:Centrosomal protein CCDC61 n=1 Tax=Holothuria leucospilota TaxID=206669 RepID=A0A9Q1HG76_HOLLE|nr:Coiled-coil domain-containing protein 61 [Holothuria leucospilota]
MTAENQEILRSASCIFRGVEYVVSAWVMDNDTLTVEVEDKLTADQWRGSFDSSYVEDLTRKTGNFKQFNIFISMLDSALAQASEAVTLDLLTYSDLEMLRNRKAGLGTRSIPGAQKAALNTKRYLIVTYTVEFDRIHYPLPLPYQGKPDPVALQNTIRDLKVEIKRLKSQIQSDFRSVELQKLQKQYDILYAEKQEVEDKFLHYRREVKNTSSGSAAKEVRILKSVVRNLEEELMHEKSKNQRSTSKRNQEYKSLLEELEELRASERNLKARVKSLMNELNVLKRGSFVRRTSRSPSIPKAKRNNPPSGSRKPLSILNRSDERSRVRGTSLKNHSRERSHSREGRRSSASSLASRSRTPSPGGMRFPRFDPTAYIEEKKRRQEEAQLKLVRERSLSGGKRSRFPGSKERGQSRSRPSSVSEGRTRRHSRGSSVGSITSRRSSSGLSDVEIMSDTSEARRRKIRDVIKPDKTSSSSAWNSPNVPYRRKPGTVSTRRLMSTPNPNMNPARAAKLASKGRIRKKDLQDYGVEDRSHEMYNRSSEMAEIDARLSALQQFMKENIG